MSEEVRAACQAGTRKYRLALTLRIKQQRSACSMQCGAWRWWVALESNRSAVQRGTHAWAALHPHAHPARALVQQPLTRMHVATPARVHDQVLSKEGSHAQGGRSIVPLQVAAYRLQSMEGAEQQACHAAVRSDVSTPLHRQAAPGLHAGCTHRSRSASGQPHSQRPSSIKAASASTHLVLHSLPCKLGLHEQRVGGGHGKRAERDRKQRQVGGAPHARAAGQRTVECQAVGDVRSCELEQECYRGGSRVVTACYPCHPA